MMIFISILLFVIVGVIAGVMAGLLGISGGLVTVPCLFALFHFLGYPQPELMQLAIGTSLAAMVFNAASSTWAHQKKKTVMWHIVAQMVIGVIIGSIAGALVARLLSSILLEILFGLY